MATLGPYAQTLKYSDGSTEIVFTPVDYEIGTIVTVVKKRDGSVVVALAE